MMKDVAPRVPGCQQRFFVKNSIPSRINIPEMADLQYSSIPEQLIELFLFSFPTRVTTKPRVKSSNVACTLGRMQSPLLLVYFLYLKRTF